MHHKRSDFPKGFLFGASTSSYQIEGHGFGGAGRTQWDDFAATPGNVDRAEHGQLACDHYHRYPEDFDLVANAGFDCYRFSTSWARVMPDGVSVNPDGLDFYDRLTDAMLERGIKPAATLYHWELPSPMSDIGGWRNRDVVERFAEYTEVLMGKIGDRMFSAAPINEPWCVAWLSHFEGHHAPGLRDIRATARAMHHVLLAHGRATEVMRGLGMKNLGAVFNFEWAEPADQSPENLLAAERYDSHYNRWYLDGVFKGQYPELMLEELEQHLPENWQDDFKTIQTPVDWCGVNYYTRKIVSHTDTPWPSFAATAGDLPQTLMGWEIYPDGLYKFLKRTAEEYTGDLPIIVTENGMASPDVVENGVVNDPQRADYLDQHLAAAKRAIDEGVPLQGYFMWSLLDNYEWSLGYRQRFGLVHVDFDTLKRTPKQSYHAISDALKG